MRDMKRETAPRLGVALLLFALCLGGLSCGGGTLFLSTDGDGITLLTVSGTVSIVQLTTLNNGQITVVTILNNSVPQTFNFCGDVAGQFPSGEFVTVTFAQRNGCGRVSQVR